MKQLLLFLICNLAFLLTVQGNSAEIPPAVMFKQLSTTEGLSNNSVRSIYRDNRGFPGWGQNQDSTNTTALLPAVLPEQLRPAGRCHQRNFRRTGRQCMDKDFQRLQYL